MNLFEQIEWTNWKAFNDQEKQTIFQQVLMYFINPLREITDVTLKNFELCGIKIRTFELKIDNEVFVFVPGQQETILGWDLGSEGLPVHRLFDEPFVDSTFKTTLSKEELEKSQKLIEPEEDDVDTLSGINAYINHHTTPLRKAQIPAMLVSAYALPAGSRYIGIFDCITGTFTGEVDLFAPIEASIQKVLFPDLSSETSITWNFPAYHLEPNEFYLEYIPEADQYHVFLHQDLTHAQLKTQLAKTGFDLPTEDQWEFFVGAGTRRLFRWGNEIDLKKNGRQNPALKKAAGPNMFGLIIDTTKTRYELTDNEKVLKLTQQMHNEQLIKNILPLSSYYQSFAEIASEEILDPQKYLYRKIISIEY